MDYQPLKYSVPIMGKDYDLPPRTIDVDAKIEEIGSLDRLYRTGKLTRMEVLTRMHSFTQDMAPGALPPLEKVDVNELTAACVNIVEAYTVDLRREKMEMKMANVLETVRTWLDDKK